MYLKNLADIPSQQGLAIIINCNTKVCTTLALLSSLRYISYPILLVDCNSKDESLNHFLKLQDKEEFFIFSTKKRPHGLMLDYLFSNLFFL